MMKFDNEIIKDFIVEDDVSVKRDNIVFINIYLIDDYIMAPYRYLIWSKNFSLKLSDYEVRLKQKQRSEKLDLLNIDDYSEVKSQE